MTTRALMLEASLIGGPEVAQALDPIEVRLSEDEAVIRVTFAVRAGKLALMGPPLVQEAAGAPR